MNRIQQVNERIIRWKEKKSKNLENISNFLLIILSVLASYFSLYTILKEKAAKMLWLIYPLSLISLTIIFVNIYFFIKQITTRRSYEKIRKTEELSVATLQALKDANLAKVRSILQSTYGRVPEWHPTNYMKNLLAYDVHEQIRAILFGLQKLIIDTTDGLNEDQVTVDLIYCYPDEDGYNGILPVSARNDEVKKWRLITSGNHSLGGSMHSFLERRESFFCYVDTRGYWFYNDKKECIDANHYLVSEKDLEFNNIGSIVGLKIELKNDQPETIFVKGILTITTYGRKLYEKGDFAKKEDFAKIFKENVLNSYKSLLLSELSQMYIRHVIRDGDMCPITGELNREKNTQNERARTCMWTGNKCKFCNSRCSYSIPASIIPKR